MDSAVMNASYVATGLQLDTRTNTLTIDTQKPIMLNVIGINERTGERKSYLLRVTPRGNLCLI
jgi:hypothetical protein